MGLEPRASARAGHVRRAGSRAHLADLADGHAVRQPRAAAARLRRTTRSSSRRSPTTTRWWRRTAQRLLVERRRTRGRAAPAPALRRELEAARAPPRALDARGTGRARRRDARARRSRDPEPGVRENAIILREPRLSRARAASPLAAKALALVDDDSPKVRFQLLATLGGVDSAASRAAQEKLLFRDLDDEWVQVAALSASPERAQAYLQAALAPGSPLIAARDAGRAGFLRRAAAAGGGRRQSETLLLAVGFGHGRRAPTGGERPWPRASRTPRRIAERSRSRRAGATRCWRSPSTARPSCGARRSSGSRPRRRRRPRASRPPRRRRCCREPRRSPRAPSDRPTSGPTRCGCSRSSTPARGPRSSSG